MNDRLTMLREKPDVTNWSLEKGYNDTDTECYEFYPYRAYGREAGGLGVVISMVKQELDNLCRIRGGFSVLLHNPLEVPQFTQHAYRFGYDRDVSVSVEPIVHITSNELRSYSANKRKCYYDGERSLLFFNTYTQGNCKMECLANFTKNECGCVKFNLPSMIIFNFLICVFKDRRR